MTTLTLPMDEPRALGPLNMHGTWAVAQILSHHENRVMKDMRFMDLGYCLPTKLERRLYSKGWKTWKKPLVPGYLFVNFYDESELFNLRNHSSCYGIIKVKNQETFAKQLDGVYRLSEAGDARMYDFPMVGQRCKIVQGSLIGLEGVVINTNDLSLFVLQIEVLGASFGKEVPPQFLEVIEDAA